jgi:hypothetical protein
MKSDLRSGFADLPYSFVNSGRPAAVTEIVPLMVAAAARTGEYPPPQKS